MRKKLNSDVFNKQTFVDSDISDQTFILTVYDCSLKIHCESMLMSLISMWVYMLALVYLSQI